MRGEVAIALVSDARMRTLNRSYRRKDYATDVLSFPAEAHPVPRAAGGALGDLVIATGVARRQAREAGHSYQTELRVLALHGLLHLLGYDHDDPKDSGRMKRTEERLRRRGRLKSGLIGRSNERQRVPASTRKRLRPAGAAGGQRRAAAPAPKPRRRRGPASTKKRLRLAGAAGGQRRAAAPATARERGWGPASTKK